MDESVGERLRREIERWGSIRGFAERMEQEHRDVRGASYPSIHRYLKGDRQPGARFVAAAAEVLGLRERYLATGVAPRTEEEGRDQHVIRGRDPEQVQRTTSAVLDAFRESAGGARPIGVFGMDHLILAVVPEVAAWIGRNGLALPGLDDAQDEQEGHRRYVEAARMLGRAVAGPLEALQLDATDWPETTKAQYVATLIASVMPLLAHAVGAQMRARLNPEDDHAEEA